MRDCMINPRLGDHLVVDGAVVYDASGDANGGPADGYVQGVGHDPWFEQDKLFVEAVRG